MRKSALFISLFLPLFYCYSQPSIVWQKSFGGSAEDVINSIEQTTDGGFIMAGYSSSNDGNLTGNHGGLYYWVVKLTDAGSIQWQRYLGGTGDERATAVLQTTDGGYVIAGSSDSNNGDVTGNHGDDDFWIVKLDNAGAIQWQRSLGGTESDYGSSIVQTADGGYLVVGQSGSNDGNVFGNHGNADCWIVKLLNTGNVQWQKCIGGTLGETACTVQQTTDGGYIIAGDSNSNNHDITGNHGSLDIVVLKLSSTGAIMWQKSFGGTGLDATYSVIQTIDGGFAIGGYSIQLIMMLSGITVNLIIG